jgi:uncharacterized damage-inducible protein DinB
MELANDFLTTSRSFFDQYLTGIKTCMERLSDEDVWWRPNEESNSVGNLLLHISGSLRHWIVSGIGGAVDHRVRQEEFDERSRIPKAQLLSNLSATLQEVNEVLTQIDPSQLQRKSQLYGTEVTWMFVIYHMVEHFSMHAGQILMITKLRTGKDLGLQ